MPQTVSLVLSSGGARGFAHIGVIQVLEEHGYQIKAISGSSIGALIGGVYAAGKLKEFEQWVCSVTRMDMLAMMDIAWASHGLMKGDKLITAFKALIGEPEIEQLSIPLTVVATDITNLKEVWFTRGPLFEAIRASISIPLLFTPYKYNGKHLIDGGVLNPVPIAPTFNDHTDLTLAVDTSGPVDPHLDLSRFLSPEPEISPEREISPEAALSSEIYTPEQEQNPGPDSPELVSGSEPAVQTALLPQAPDSSNGADNTMESNGNGWALGRFIDQLQSSFGNGKSKEREPASDTERSKARTRRQAKAELKGYDIALKGIDAMQSTIARQKLAAYPPDVLIEIPKNACAMLEFDRAEQIIALGRERAEACLAQL